MQLSDVNRNKKNLRLKTEAIEIKSIQLADFVLNLYKLKKNLINIKFSF